MGARYPGTASPRCSANRIPGKTHLAIERMVAHSSGVIGLPLRLLGEYQPIVNGWRG